MARPAKRGTFQAEALELRRKTFMSQDADVIRPRGDSAFGRNDRNHPIARHGGKLADAHALRVAIESEAGR
jgi:hypothetical protein